MPFRICLFFCLAFPFLTGWGHWGPPVKVGVSIDQAQNRDLLSNKMREEMEDNRGELLVQDAKGDPATQETQVRELIQQGVQALVVIPCNPEKAGLLVDIAHQAGIKVISLERLIPGSDLDYMIAFNQEKAGELQAQALIKRTPKGRFI